MAEAQSVSVPSLAEQYAMPHKEKEEAMTKSADMKEPDNLVTAASEEVTVPPAEVPPTDVSPPASKENADAPADEAPAEKSEEAPPAADSGEETAEASEEGNSGDGEAAEEPEIKLETAPLDFRFPTTNQTRHCFTRYIEYHRCVAAKGEGASECDKYAKYYRSLCPGEWVDRWNEQRENGTFPGPL